MNISNEPSITQIPIGPNRPFNATAGGIPPEVLAVTGARFSRSLQSFDDILSPYADSFDTSEGINAATRSIFAHLDYGHNSIIDMVPIAFELRGITQYAALMLWYIAPRAVGQESSTRYIDFKNQPLRPITAFDNTLDNSLWEDWASKQMQFYLDASEYVLEEYARKVEEKSYTTIIFSRDAEGRLIKGDPDEENSDTLLAIWHIPVSPIEEQDPKKRLRFMRNAVFDRLRGLLPLAVTTNVYMQLPLRDWLDVMALFAASPCTELQQIASMLRRELESGPQALNDVSLLKYATPHADHEAWWYDFFNYLPSAEDSVRLDATSYRPSLITENTRHPKSRYSPAIRALSRVNVTYEVTTDVGALRDMNRHRVGTRELQIALNRNDLPEAVRDKLWAARHKPLRLNYATLDTPATWRHSTNLAHVAYVVNLRTGPGSHFAYRRVYEWLGKAVAAELRHYGSRELRDLFLAHINGH